MTFYTDFNSICRLVILAFCNTVSPPTVTKVMLEMQRVEKVGLSRDGLSTEPRISWSSRATSQASVVR